MNREQFLEFANLLHEPSFLVSAEGIVRAANAAACEAVGMANGEVSGHCLTDLVSDPPKKIQHFLRLCSGSRHSVLGSLTLGSGDASEQQFRCDGVMLGKPTADAGADIFLRCTPRGETSSRFVLLNRKIEELNKEIREHQRAEERIRRFNKELEQRIEERTRELEASNKELESYSYSIAHDLRTPLRSIISFSQILLEECTERLDEEGRDYLVRVVAAGKHMSQLVDDILELSRVSRSALQKESIAISELVQGVIERFEGEQSQCVVEWRVQPGLNATGDPTLLNIVIENLVSNALKYSGKTEKPCIEFGAVSQEQKGERVYFIRDNGIGFDMRYADKLFGVFQRLHGSEFEGTGVGLATVQRIVQRHGGRVWGESREGEGATFYFSLV